MLDKSLFLRLRLLDFDDLDDDRRVERLELLLFTDTDWRELDFVLDKVLNVPDIKEKRIFTLYKINREKLNTYKHYFFIITKYLVSLIQFI